MTLFIQHDYATRIRELLSTLRSDQDRLSEAGLYGWDDKVNTLQDRIDDNQEALIDIIGHVAWKNDTLDHEVPDPPSAPIWYDSTEASAWEGGWRSGYSAALGLDP